MEDFPAIVDLPPVASSVASIVNAKKPLANAFLEEALAMLGDAMPTTLVAAAMATVTRTMAKDPTFKGTR